MASWTNIASSWAPESGEPVPARPEDLRAEWLSASLTRAGVLAPAARVREFSYERIGQGRGYAGKLARVALSYEPSDAGPASMIAKFATEHEATRDLLGGISAYQREVRFYRELAARIGVPTPRCYFAHYDEASARFCLLLEDLAPATSVDVEIGLDLEHAKLALEQIAALHARWWNRTAEVPWLELDPQLLATVRARFVAALPGFRAEYAARYPLTERIASQIAVLLRDDAVLARAAKPPRTFAHNDLHLDNVFFPSAQGGRFAIIDWQAISGSRHGVGDVTRLLCVGMRTELRRKHQTELLAHYHAKLCELGVRGFSFSQLKRRVREELASTVMIGVMAFATLDFSQKGGDRIVHVMGERVEEALRDARVARTFALLLPFYRLRYACKRFLRRTLRLPSS